MKVTINQLKAALDAHLAAGVSGDTIVGVPSLDNNGKHGLISFDVSSRMSSVAKDEFNKGWEQCRFVTRGGVPVLVIG